MDIVAQYEQYRLCGTWEDIECFCEPYASPLPSLGCDRSMYRCTRIETLRVAAGLVQQTTRPDMDYRTLDLEVVRRVASVLRTVAIEYCAEDRASMEQKDGLYALSTEFESLAYSSKHDPRSAMYSERYRQEFQDIYASIVKLCKEISHQ
jgi:hypothetical protein